MSLGPRFDLGMLVAIDRRGVRPITCLLLLEAFAFSSTRANAQELSEEQAQETVVVQGSTVPRAPAEPEVSSSVVRGAALAEPGAELSDVLSRQPGVQVNRTGTSADLSTASIRGDAGSQVPVYLAGIRLNDDIVGVADLSRVPLFMIDRVEVYRGALPLKIVRGGMNGAIVLEPRLPKQNELRLGASSGSYGAAAAWAGATGAWTGDDARSTRKFATTVAVRRAGARNDFDYRADEGTVFVGADDRVVERANADFVENDVWVLSRGIVPQASGPVTVNLLFNHFSREKGVSGLALLPALAARERLSRDLVGWTSRMPCGSKACRMSFSSSYSRAHLETIDPAGELGLLAPEVDQENERTSHEGRFVWRLGPKVEAGWGGSFEAARISIDSPDVDLARAREAYGGALASLAIFPESSWFVRTLVRGSCVDATGVDAGALGSGEQMSWSQCHPEGRLGTEITATPSVRVRALVSRGIRYPTLGERFGVSATTRGNVDLLTEKAWSADAGMTFAPAPRPFGNVWFDAAVFARRSSDLVAFRRSALGYVRPYNVGAARFVGAEASGQVTLLDHVRVSANVSLLDPRDVSETRSSGSDLIPHRSRLSTSQELEIYARKVLPAVTRLGVMGSFTYRGARVADPAGLVVVPEQGILDLSAHVRLFDEVDLRGRIENLLATARFDSLGFPLPGRAFFLSAEVATFPER